MGDVASVSDKHSVAQDDVEMCVTAVNAAKNELRRPPGAVVNDDGKYTGR